MKTVAQLIEELRQYDGSLPVVIFTGWSNDPPSDPEPRLTTTPERGVVVFLDYDH